MPIIQICRSVKKNVVEVVPLDTNKVSYFGLMQVYAEQFRLKDPQKSLPLLENEFRARLDELEMSLREVLESDASVTMGVLKTIPGPLKQEFVKAISALIAGQNAQWIVRELGLNAALNLTALQLGPGNLREVATQMRREAVEAEKLRAIQRVATRERLIIRGFMEDAEHFCSQVLGTSGVTSGIRTHARKLLQTLKKRQEVYASTPDKDLVVGTGLAFQQAIREDLVVLRDAIRDELQDREQQAPSKASARADAPPRTPAAQLLSRLEEIQYDRLLRDLRIRKDGVRQAYELILTLLRRAVYEALLPLAADLALLDRTCRLYYRGSLTDGLRNTTKSQVGPGGLKAAQLLDPTGFDVDAFIDLPDLLWQSWVDRKFVPPEKAAQSKCSLTDISNHLAFFKKDPLTIEEGAKRETFLANRDAALALRERLIVLEASMNEAKARLAKLPGYKRTGGNEIDFSLIIQPTSKTEKQRDQGKPYSSGELARSVLGVREVFLRHEATRGEDLLTALAPEIHVEINRPSGPTSRPLL